MTRNRLLAQAAVAAMLAVAGHSPAMAVVSTLTWAPSLSSPALSTDAPNITFQDITLQDLATVYLTPNASGGFNGTEEGFLPATSFNGSTPLGLNGSLGANPYGIYGQFTGTFSVGSSGVGVFSAVNFQLIGDPGYLYKSGAGGFVFSPTTGAAQTSVGTSPNAVATGDVQLATGTLAPSPPQNQAQFINGIPTAAVTTTFVQTAGQGGFFVAPSATVNLDLFGTFTNNINQVECFANPGFEAACGLDPIVPGGVPLGAPAGTQVMIQIGGGGTPGGGSADFAPAPVPEPTSLAILGGGLIGLQAMLRRRRNRRA